MVVIVADAAHEGGMFRTEHCVALVLCVGAQQVEAHEVALRHAGGVGQQGVEEGQRGVWPGIHQAVGAVEAGAVLGRGAGDEHHGQHNNHGQRSGTRFSHHSAKVRRKAKCPK